MAPKIFTMSCDLSDIEIEAEHGAASQSSAAQPEPSTSSQSSAAQTEPGTSYVKPRQGGSWSDFYKIVSKGKASGPSPDTSMKKRRQATVCLKCLKAGSKNLNLIDTFESTVKRHVQRNHSKEEFDWKENLRPKDHEDVKAARKHIQKRQPSGKRQGSMNTTLSHNQEHLQIYKTNVAVATAESVAASTNMQCVSPDAPEPSEASQPTTILDQSPEPTSYESDCLNVHHTFQEKLQDLSSAAMCSTPIKTKRVQSQDQNESEDILELVQQPAQTLQKSIDTFCTIRPETTNITQELLKSIDGCGMWTLDKIGANVLEIKNMLLKSWPMQASFPIPSGSSSSAGKSWDLDDLGENLLQNASNINDVIAGKEFIITEKDGSAVISCSICQRYLTSDEFVAGHSIKKSKAMKGHHSTGTLSTGKKLDSNNLEAYKRGHNQAWFNFKSRLVNHVSSQDSESVHFAARVFFNAPSKVKLRSTMVTETIVRTALHVVQSKGAASHFETTLGLLKACGTDVGDIGHSRMNFNQICRAATLYICKKNVEILMQPLPSTTLPPHFYFTADKATINRKTNQAIILGLMNEGKRVAVPIGAPLVYRGAVEQDGSITMVGGTAAELADAIIDTILQKSGLPADHLSYLTGNYLDSLNAYSQFLLL